MKNLILSLQYDKIRSLQTYFYNARSSIGLHTPVQLSDYIFETIII